MFKILYGNWRFSTIIEKVLFPFKIIYFIYTLPFLLFSVLLYLRTFGVFSASPNEKFSLPKILALHMAAVVISFGLWISIMMVLESVFEIVLVG